MHEQHDFDDAFRRWASRPPATSAPEAARVLVARVRAQGGRSHVGQAFSFAGRRFSPAWATLALAIFGIIAGAASFIRSLPPVSPAPAAGNVATPTAVPARDADVVLWLDDGTPVYVFLPDGD